MEAKFRDNKWNPMNADSRHTFMHDKYAEGMKKKLDLYNSNKSWSFRLPWECMTLRERSGPLEAMPKIEITSKDLMGAFDPVVQKILDLVDDQVAKVHAKTGAYPKVSHFVSQGTKDYC